MPYTSNIYQLRQFTQRYSHTHPHLVLRLSIHLSNCSLTTLHIPQKLLRISHVDSLWPHGLQPARLLCPWDFPSKNTGVSC